MIPDLKEFEAWFVTGSQHLYGEEALKQVAAHSEHIVKELNASDKISVKVIYKPILTTSESILNLCQEANSAKNCIGLITWMHTFSPAKMWIAGLSALQKPFVHLHTQFNRDIPWSDIDMDFMNLNQSAHGGREFGFIGSRMRINRKVIAGHWEDPEVQGQLDVWLRAACAHYDMQGAKFARFGDNMRNVAVTEGNKVSAQINFGYSVDGYGVGDLVAKIDQIKSNVIEDLLKEYDDKYILDDQLKPNGKRRDSLRDAAKIELGIKAFLEEGGFKGFTDTFEDLHGLKQLPGIAVQRLMAQGYGFGAEGDWKTAALVRAMKVMASGLEGGNSFMEDYTYHFQPGNMSCLGAHMLEICESITNEKPKCEIHPLGIGGKEDPVRLVFDVAEGEALNASVVDMGNRFRMLVNTVKAVQGEPLPKLPVARVLWQPKPDLKTAAAAWIQSGGAHHTCYSQNITPEFLEDYASMCDMEFVLIDENTQLRELQKELRWNEVYYHLNN